MKCPLCEFSTQTENDMVRHINISHKDVLNDRGMLADQYWYHHKNRHKLKNIGVCSCGKKKPWNVEKGRYEHYCMTPEHRAKLNQEFENNMEEKYGTKYPASQKEHQIKMMEGRSIAKRFRWDGHEFVVLGQIEYDVLQLLKDMKFRASDIEAPAMSINVKYKLPNETKLRNHIPDIFIKSLNLIISCKDGMDNPNRHPNMKKDRIKNLYEYEAILNNTNYSYIQVEGKQGVKDFVKHMKTVREMFRKGSRYVLPPRVDVHMLLERHHYDEITVDKDGRFYLGSSSDESRMLIDESGRVVPKIQIEDPILLNYNRLLNDFSDEYNLTEVTVENIDDIPYILSEVAKVKKKDLVNYLMAVIE